MPLSPLKPSASRLSLVIAPEPRSRACPRPGSIDNPDRAPRLKPERPHLRQWVQFAFLAVTLAIGIQFALFVHQAAGTGSITIARPPGVEGFLPIGALMGWKWLFVTGTWDPIHPASMVLLGFSALLCLALRKVFCSWLCPVGTLSEWLWRGGRAVLGRNFQLPRWLDLALRPLKYILLGFFVWVILHMDVRAIAGFLHSPYYKMSDVKMLHFFSHMSVLTAGILLLLITGSFFTRNFWCRFLCPYGALMGLLAFIGPTRIRRRADTCVDCGRCTRACPYHLPVDRKSSVSSAECTGCMDCVRACPVAGTLKLATGGPKARGWTRKGLAVALVLSFVGIVYTARITGHWQSRMSPAEFRQHLPNIDSAEMTHP